MEIKVLPTSLARLVDYISTAIKHEEKLTPLRARELVLAADVQEEDMMQYADFDHPIEDCYGRKMVHDNGNFEVMVMSWNPNHYSSIHNHGYTEWGVVQAFGNVHHFIYKEKDGRLIFSKKEISNLPLSEQYLFQRFGHGPITRVPYRCIHYAFLIPYTRL